MSTNLLQVKSLAVATEHGETLLHDFSFEVRKGSVTPMAPHANRPHNFNCEAHKEETLTLRNLYDPRTKSSRQ